VAYEPWRAVRALVLRVGPDADAPPVLSNANRPVALTVGQHLGRQSTRNPTCRDVPRLRAAVNGFVWGYGMPPVTRKSGWAELAALEPDPAHERFACGPAGVDFDRRDRQSCGGHCDGRPLTGVRATSRRKVVTARETYLRYAPGSTAFRYLVRGDVVSRLAHTDDARWTAVEVRAARWAGAATRGWVLTSSLRAREPAVDV
jgi:hypothetical protein